MSAPTTGIVAQVRCVVTALTAAHPGAAARIARGAALVVADAVAPVHGIGFLVTSASEPGRSYWVQRVGDVLTCDCEDARHRGNPCKHGWSCIIHTAAERLDAEASDPAVIPFPSPSYNPETDRFELTAMGEAYLSGTAESPLA
jgi:hypothetical protein